MSERTQQDRTYYKEYINSRLDTRPDIDHYWYFDEVERLEAALAAVNVALVEAEEMVKTLEWLDAIGGLGFDVHARIRRDIARFHAAHRKVIER